MLSPRYLYHAKVLRAAACGGSRLNPNLCCPLANLLQVLQRGSKTKIQPLSAIGRSSELHKALLRYEETSLRSLMCKWHCSGNPSTCWRSLVRGWPRWCPWNYWVEQMLFGMRKSCKLCPKSSDPVVNTISNIFRSNFLLVHTWALDTLVWMRWFQLGRLVNSRQLWWRFSGGPKTTHILQYTAVLKK